MRKCKIDKLCDELNALRGLEYPSIGYLYFADVRGDGVKRKRTVWQVINPSGGVSQYHSGRDPKQVIRHLSGLIRAETRD